MGEERFKVIIAGSRSFNDFELLVAKCDKLLSAKTEGEVVSGTARGTDQLGENYAKERGFPIKKFPANWEKYGKIAGYKRNEEMADYADALIAFWDGLSPGTKHMISTAEKKGLKVRVFRY